MISVNLSVQNRPKTHTCCPGISMCCTSMGTFSIRPIGRGGIHRNPGSAVRVYFPKISTKPKRFGRIIRKPEKAMAAHTPRPIHTHPRRCRSFRFCSTSLYDIWFSGVCSRCCCSSSDVVRRRLRFGGFHCMCVCVCVCIKQTSGAIPKKSKNRNLGNKFPDFYF